MSWSGAEDPVESEDKGGSYEEGPGGFNTTEEVHEQQRKEEESVKDAEEGMIVQAEKHTHQHT